MKKATYVAISTQKGGAGKTTLTVLVASYLHYVKGYNVAVVDCDFPQYSIHDMRKRDMKAVMEDGHYKVMAYEQLKRLKKNPYTIRCSRAEDAVKTAENLVAAQPDLDFVFFDLPGTINNADVVQTISKMDYIFTPIIADRVVMESSIKFATVINEQMISTGKSGIKGIYLVWNMVDGREKTELYKAYDKVCAEFALPILETHLPDSKRFRKETAAERDVLRKENRDLQMQVKELGKELARVQLSQGLAGNAPDQSKAIARVNRLMREVDKCIALLRQAAPQADEPHGKGGQTERDFDTDKDNG